MKKLRKVKTKKVKHPANDSLRIGYNTKVKNKGKLWTRVIKKKSKTNLLLAWKIQSQED